MDYEAYVIVTFLFFVFFASLLIKFREKISIYIYKIILKIKDLKLIFLFIDNYQFRFFMLTMLIFYLITLLNNTILNFITSIFLIIILIPLMYYYMSYCLLFKVPETKEKINFFSIESITDQLFQPFFEKIFFIIYFMVTIWCLSILIVLAPIVTIEDFLKGDYENSIQYFFLIIYLSILNIPPFLFKILSFSQEKTKLIMNVIKNSLAIIYSFISIYLLIFSLNFNNNLQLLAFFIFSLIIFTNILFLLIEIIDYYKKKITESMKSSD